MNGWLYNITLAVNLIMMFFQIFMCTFCGEYSFTEVAIFLSTKMVYHVYYTMRAIRHILYLYRTQNSWIWCNIVRTVYCVQSVHSTMQLQFKVFSKGRLHECMHACIICLWWFLSENVNDGWCSEFRAYEWISSGSSPDFI